MNATAINRTNTAEVFAAGELFQQYGGREIALRVIEGGGTVLDFHRQVNAQIARTDLDAAMGLNLSRKDLGNYSMLRAINAFANPRGHPREAAPLEHEISDAIEKQTGRSTGLLMVPWSCFRDFNVGGAAEAGPLTGAPIPFQYTADPLRAALALGRLGATIAGGFMADFTIPRFTSDFTGAFVTEVGSSSEVSPNTAQVTFAARRFSGYIEPSRQALLQVVPLEGYVRRALIESAAAALESGAINGSGSSPNLLGIRNTSSIGTVAGGTNGAQLAFSHLADLEAAPGTANAPEIATGFLVNSKTRRWLRTQPRGSGLPYIWEGGERPLLGHRAAVTNNAPSNLTKGTSTTVCSSVLFSSDWSKAMLATFGAPGITVDTATMAATGQVRITLSLYAAFGLLQPGAFAVMDDALTT